MIVRQAFATFGYVVLLSFLPVVCHAANADDWAPMEDPDRDVSQMGHPDSPVSKQVHAIESDFGNQDRPTARQRFEIRRKIIDLMSSANAVDTENISSLEKQIGDLSQQLANSTVDEWLKIRSLATADQLRTMAQHHKDHVAAYAKEWAKEHGSKPETYEVLSRDYSQTYPYGDSLGYTRGVRPTDAQSKEINRLEVAAEQARLPLEVEFAKVGNEFSDQFETDGAIDPERLKALRRQEIGIKSQIAAVRLDMMVQIRATLTPEQLAEAAKLHQKELADIEAQRIAAGGEPLSVTGKTENKINK